MRTVNSTPVGAARPPAISERASWLSSLQTRHSLWFTWSVVYAALAALCLSTSFIDERTFQGISTWNKPFKFALSLAVYFASLACFANLLQPGYFNTLRGKWLTQTPIVCAVFEMSYILVQGARNDASHFNFTSPFYATMYGLMGIGAALMVVCCAWMGTSILRHRGATDPWVLAVGMGLIATCVLGGGFGGYLGGAGSHWVGESTTDADGFAFVHWSRTGGDLRVAHFFGIHAMQMIPVVGAMAAGLEQRRWLGNSAARLAVIAFSAGFALFTMATFVQAVRGLPII